MLSGQSSTGTPETLWHPQPFTWNRSGEGPLIEVTGGITARAPAPSASFIAYTSYPVAAWGVRLVPLKHTATTQPDATGGGPPMLGAIRGGSVESRELDFTPDLAPSGDSIITVLGVSVSRVDGAPLGMGDLVISPPNTIRPWLTGGAIVGWWASASAQIAIGGPVFYKVSVTVSTALGSTPRTRDVYQTVTNALG